MTLQGQVAQAIISGLNIGCIYAILGLTIAVVYNVSRIFDVSQGQYVMLGAMLICLFQSKQLSLGLSIVLALLIPIALGLLIWRMLFYGPSQKYPALTLIMITFGIALLIEGLAYLFLGTDTRIASSYLKISPVKVFGGTISPQSLLIYALLTVMISCIYLLFNYTIIGKALRACHDTPLAARLMGINPPKMMFYSFLLAITLGAIGGIMMVPLTAATYNMGIHLIIKGFLAALVGGISRFHGVIIGGIALGLSESLSAGFISSGYSSIIALSLFVVLLLFRPSSLLVPKGLEG